MKKHFVRRLLATSLLAAVLVFTGTLSSLPVYGDSIEDQLDDLKEQQQQAQEEREQLEQQVADAQDDRSGKITEMNALQDKIDLAEEELSLIDQRIALLDGQIATKEQEIEDKQAEIDANMETFQKRLRAMYENDDPTMLNVIFSSTDLSDFLVRTENVSRIAQHDRELIDSLLQAQQEIQQQKEDLAADKQDLEDTRAEQQALKDSLDADRDYLSNQVVLLDSQIASSQEEIDQLAQQEEQFAQDIQDIYDQLAQQGGSGGGPSEGDGSVDGYLAWPCPGYKGIYSEFGWRPMFGDFHTGIDISGGAIYGKSVVSAESGTVLVAHTTNDGSAGKYIIVDHGNGLTTLYAHLSAVNVYVGQTVSRGQQIGQVGSTGWSSGPHLHFEVRVNGEYQNPLDYLDNSGIWFG